MARKRDTAEPIIGTRREAEVALAQGENVGTVARRRGVAEPPDSRRPRESGGLRVWTRRSASRSGSARTCGGRRGWPTRRGTPPSARRSRREISAPGALAPGGHARAGRAGRLGAPGLSGPRPAAPPAAAPRPGGDGRARPDRPDHRPGPPRRPVRLPAHPGPAAGRGRAGEPQAGGAAVASGGAARAPQRPAAAATRGHGRLLHAAPSRAAEPRRVRRLRPRADAGRPGPAPADHRGRVHAGVPPQRRRPAPARRRRPRPAAGALRAARPAGLPPLRQRPGVHRESAGAASTTRSGPTAPSAPARPPQTRWRSDLPTPPPGQTGGAQHSLKHWHNNRGQVNAAERVLSRLDGAGARSS